MRWSCKNLVYLGANRKKKFLRASGTNCFFKESFKRTMNLEASFSRRNIFPLSLSLCDCCLVVVIRLQGCPQNISSG